MNHFPLITTLTFVPFVGAIVLAFVGRGNKSMPRGFALAVSFISLALALVMWKGFDASSGGFQFEENHAWIPTLGVYYRVAVDGLGLLMVLLTAILTPMAILASWRTEDRPHIYFSLILFLQSGLFGTFTALNFVHWFLFWELSLVPAFFLVRLWGGPQRAAAAMQFFVYTMVGSVALLLAFLAIFLATRNGPELPGVFDFTKLAEIGRNDGILAGVSMNLDFHFFGFALTASKMTKLIFLAALLGFAVKVPMMPFHTWLPATYTEAPSGTTMLLTGAMSKMGVYGLLRILLPIFPNQVHALRTPLLVLAIITIVFSASAAFAQKDLKRIFAYSSINHLGYCLLAVFAVATTKPLLNPMTEKAAALSGVMLQMFNHGLTAATIFWFIALLEQRSGGLRGLNDFGGIRKVVPVFCGMMGIALFSSLGLPGLNGFVGEFLIFKGVFPLTPRSASLSVIGLLVTAIFILTVLQRVFNGPLNEKWSKLPDLTTSERVMLGVPIALMFVLGVYPQLVLGFVNNTVLEMVKHLPS